MELYADRSGFKLYMGDTGLLVTQIMKNHDDMDENIYKSLIFGRLGINQGMIMENMAAQMLRVNGNDLYYHAFRYKSENAAEESAYEIDFLTVRKKKCERPADG